MTSELFEKICEKYDLGEQECTPCRLKGGFLHKMYSLFTSKGRYAVKLLNPYIMQRENVMDNYRTAESLELMLEKNDIPILPALIFEDKKMQNIDGQFFYLYEWYDGTAVKSDEVREIHCRKIGESLARIHNLHKRKEAYRRSEVQICWEFYIERLAGKNDGLCYLLKENLALLYESQRKGNEAIKKLPPVVSVCHNDMDCKNVLWAGTDFRIIDLECLGYSSPFVELYETALCWSGYDRCHIDYELLRLFVRSYAESGGVLPADWETVYWSNYGRLEWLKYNIKRSLGVECSAEEIETGVSEVKNTMEQVVYYHDEKENILNCLRSV